MTTSCVGLSATQSDNVVEGEDSAAFMRWIIAHVLQLGHAEFPRHPRSVRDITNTEAGEAKRTSKRHMREKWQEEGKRE
jgi:hypothetical protein